MSELATTRLHLFASNSLKGV